MIKVIVAILVVLAAAAAGAYYVSIPSTWPAPTISIEVPDTAQLGRDIPLTVTVHSEHTNIAHHEAIFVPAGYLSTATVPDKLIYPLFLEKSEPKESWDSGEVSFKTKETETAFRYVVPLSEPYIKGSLQAGTLKGRVDFVVDYPVVPKTGGLLNKQFPNMSETLSASFQIELTD